ncbi:MAG: carotenoid oxygenase family protein [Rubrivivax sp.]|nr:carotenoid oxygenase family protein [Rubrivivax sp.]
MATEERIDLHGGELRLHLMAAHGCTLADGSYLNVGNRLGRSCEQKLFRQAPGATEAVLVASVTMARAGCTHAFALAPGHAILCECALRAKVLSLRFGAAAYKDNFAWDPAAGSRLHAVPLNGGAVRSWDIPPMMAFHATQAWSDGDALMLERAIYADAAVFDELTLERRRQGLPTRTVPKLVRYPLRPGQRRARVCWGASGFENGEFFDCILRVDLGSGAAGAVLRLPRRVHAGVGADLAFDAQPTVAGALRCRSRRRARPDANRGAPGFQQLKGSMPPSKERRSKLMGPISSRWAPTCSGGRRSSKAARPSGTDASRSSRVGVAAGAGTACKGVSSATESSKSRWNCAKRSGSRRPLAASVSTTADSAKRQGRGSRTASVCVPRSVSARSCVSKRDQLPVHSSGPDATSKLRSP